MASSSQSWDPQTYARNARFVSDLAGPVLELLAPRAGERILDLGCGDGVLTAKLAAIGCDMVGVDGSIAQVEAARALGLDARVMDGERLDFEADFDAVFSNAALHWMRRPDAVIGGVRRALKPGGRFVAEMGGDGCVAKIKAALVGALARRGIEGAALNPWYFPTIEDYCARLRAGGFTVQSAALIPRPTELPGDITGWLATFAQSFTAALAPAQRPAFIAEVQAALEPQLCDRQGCWWADYVRLRFSATKVS
ncbi:MAG TPA: class I SAM-dependent methyltransferase [Candidatus Binataceae bacterium]|jgi:SAM-dependent methyltransferase|nr:class I SAM-dependent methyltransferase [Candidatus Binataceae bacterium]